MPSTPALPPRDEGAVDLSKPSARTLMPEREGSGTPELPQGQTMVGDSDTHDSSGRVVNIFADGGDANDVAHLREQDQAIAQYGAQLDAAVGSPWEESDASGMYSIDVIHKSAPVRRVAMQIGCMCVPPASVATQGSNVGVGSITAVVMGNRKITVPGSSVGKDLSTKLNKAYADIVGPRQAKLIASLNKYAKEGDAAAGLPSADYKLALRAGNTYVVCASVEDLTELKARLDEAFARLTKDYVALILAELAHVTEPTAGARFNPSAR